MTAFSKQTKQYHLPIVLLVAASILVFFYFQQTQSPLTHRGGMGWDGEHYYKIAQQIIDEKPIVGAGPLVHRVGTPAVAAMLVKFGMAKDIMTAFFYVNISFSFANIFLVFFIISRFFNPWIALIGGVLYPLHWINIARYTFFTALWTDPGGLFFLYLGLAAMIVLRQRRGLSSLVLTAVTFVGVLFREFVMMLPLLFLMMQTSPRSMFLAVKSRAWRDLFKYAPTVLPPLVAGLLGILIIKLLVEPNTSYRFWKSAMYIFWTNSPQYYLYTIFATLGIAVVFLILQSGFVVRYLKEQPLILYTLAILLFAGFLGGDNNEKYLGWAFPFLFIVTAKAIAEEGIAKWAIAATLVFYVVFVCRLPWPIPDYRNDIISPFPVFTYLTADFRLNDLFVLHSNRNVSGIIFYQYLVSCAALILAMRYRQAISWLRRTFGAP
ncbi:MAG: hypothetical protein HOC72_18800 [Rhodospirillaceae bacterium]|jgi:hypothetical protein|nr:hypothetical protein [Rhodospirillaceae bacterium]